MKNVKKIKLILFFCSIYAPIILGGLVESAGKKLPETKIILKSIVEEKEEQLKTLNHEKELLLTEKELAEKNIKSDSEETNNKRVIVARELQKTPDDEFLTKKLALLTETYDVLNDLLRTWENVIKKITDHISLLEKYIKDPDQKEYRKNLKITAGPYFFEDLEEIYQKMISQQKFVDQLRKRKENLIKEQKNQNIALEKTSDEYKDKKITLDELAKTSGKIGGAVSPLGFTITQKLELAHIELNLAKLKNDVAQLQAQEKKQDLALIDNELFIETIHLDVLIEMQRLIKSSITVTAEQIEISTQELEKKKNNFSIIKTRYNDEITKLRKVRTSEEARLVELSKRYGIPLGNELELWNWQPKKTLDSYVGICEVGLLATYINLLEDQEKLFQTIIALENEKISYAEEIVKIKETYNKVALSKFSSEDETTQEIKKYTELQIAHEILLKSYKAKKDEIEASLSKLQQEIVDRIKKRKVDVVQQKDTLFKNHLNEFALCLNALNKSEEYNDVRVGIYDAINKSYTESITMLEKIAGYSRFMLTELESITIWYRPEYAITWQGLQNAPHDIKMFFYELWSYVGQVHAGIVIEKLKDIILHPFWLLLFIVQLVGLFVIFFLIKHFSLPIMTRLHSNALSRKTGIVQCLLYACELGIGFIVQHTVILYMGCAFLVWLFSIIPDPYIYSIAYLLAIPYVCYILVAFINNIRIFNQECSFCLISHDFEDRFLGVISTISYATISLMLFAKAFSLIKIPKSEVGAIAGALISIIFQISLILLISKEYLLNIIPSRAQWLYEFIDRYYYLLLALIIAILILSNSYIGYGRLVTYLLISALYTVILLHILLKTHVFIKKSASQVFFVSQEDIVRERFGFAKTWFGVTIILSFTILALIGLVIGGKIWGWPLAFKDILKWLNAPLLGIGAGTSSPLTVVTIGTILIFILGGFLIAYAFNTFVLEKIFDLMLVDSGVQDAITSLIRYVLVAAAIILGFQSVGYGGILTYVYVLILGIGYLIQNPLNDLIAYFIILMQRPIKVGDYIEIDNEIRGIVRKITPKSVILRRKNSTTIVVPNTQIINKSVTNWNYSRNFIAFDDIIVVVSYKSDPARVKDILLSIVDAHPKVLKNPKPMVRLDDFKDHGFEYMVRGFLSSNLTLERHDIASDVRIAIINVLRQHNIEIAVPVRVMIASDEHASDASHDN